MTEKRNVRPTPDFSEVASLYYDMAAIDDTELEYLHRVARQRQRIDIATGFGSVREQKLPVYVTQSPKQDWNKAVVAFMPWSDDGGRPEYGLLDAKIADELTAPVIRVNTPGIDYHPWRTETGLFSRQHRLTHDQHEELITKGSLSKVSRALYVAASGAIENLPGYRADKSQSLILTGQSMSGATASAAVPHVSGDGRKISGMSLIEVANTRKRSPFNLTKALTQEFGNQQSYVDQNEDYLNTSWESDRQFNARVVEAGLANIALGQALARGKLIDDADYFESLEGQDTSVVLTSGGASEISDDAGDKEIMYHLQNAGANVAYNHYRSHAHPLSFLFRGIVADLIHVNS